ncbi:MAG: hypothetical protein Q8P45_03290 [Candidatus Harrisonbacteria bacterium]|nr:hypothetical protein [Candidatus Harrisonbacteria bacterium]
MEHIPNPEEQEDKRRAIALRIKEKLEALGGRKITLIRENVIEVEFKSDALVTFEHIGKDYALEEILTFLEDNVLKYEATFYGVDEVTDEVLELIERTERERGVDLNKPVASLEVLKRLQGYIES